MGEVHHLKAWTPMFREIKYGKRDFDVRKNDRDYKVGDTLILNDFDPVKEKFTGDWAPRLITFKFDNKQFVKEGYVILGLREIKF